MFKRLVLRWMSDRPSEDIRNQAIQQCVRTFGIHDAKLAAFLRRHPQPDQASIAPQIRAVIAAIDSRLYAPHDAARWDMTLFLPALQEDLRAEFPWLSDRAFQQFRSYCFYMAWHDGL